MLPSWTHLPGAPYAGLSTAKLVNPPVRFGGLGRCKPSRPLSTKPEAEHGVGGSRCGGFVGVTGGRR